MSKLSSSYDPIAEMYHALWANWYLPAAMPALERMFFDRIPAAARVLDLCCGSGHVTRELVGRGYRVTGLDASAGLIAIARREMPQVDWRVADARQFQVDLRFDAALSTFDSLNHLTSIEDLGQAFASVQRALLPGGRFTFDMNLDEAYLSDSPRWTIEVHEKTTSLIRGIYDPLTRIACTDLVWFVREQDGHLWRQHKSSVRQRSYSQSEIINALTREEFTRIEAIPASQAGMTAELGFGRLFVTAETKT